MDDDDVDPNWQNIPLLFTFSRDMYEQQNAMYAKYNEIHDYVAESDDEDDLLAKL
jgi:hypothetical protein